MKYMIQYQVLHYSNIENNFITIKSTNIVTYIYIYIYMYNKYYIYIYTVKPLSTVSEGTKEWEGDRDKMQNSDYCRKAIKVSDLLGPQ
jgi:hypothetical protein